MLTSTEDTHLHEVSASDKNSSIIQFTSGMYLIIYLSKCLMSNDFGMCNSDESSIVPKTC